MRNHRLLTIIGAGIASLLSSWLPAIAQPVLTYNGASTYKDSKDNIYMVNSGGVPENRVANLMPFGHYWSLD